MPYRSILIAALQAAGLTVPLFIIPVLGQVLSLFAPVPLVIIAVREGRAAGLAAMVAAAALIAVIAGGQFLFVLFVLSFGLMAAGIAEGMLRRLRPEQAILAGGLLPIAALILILIPFMLKSGKNPLTLAESYLRTSITDAQQLYTQLGIAEISQMLASVTDRMLFYLVRLSPGVILTASLFQAAVCFGMARSIILRKSPDVPLSPEPSLATWHAPDSWVWGLIAALGLVALPNESTRLIGLNLVAVYLLVYTAQGVTIVEYLLRKVKIAVIWRSFIHTIILTLPLVALVIALGVVDIWADFRKVRGPSPHS